METKLEYCVTSDAERCTGTTADGAPCLAWAKKGTNPPVCWFHDARPQEVEARDIARRQGGRKTAYKKVLIEGPVDVATIQGLQRQLAEVLENLRLMDSTPQVCGQITQAVRAAGDLLTANVLEARFLEIEELIKEQS